MRYKSTGCIGGSIRRIDCDALPGCIPEIVSHTHTRTLQIAGLFQIGLSQYIVLLQAQLYQQLSSSYRTRVNSHNRNCVPDDDSSQVCPDDNPLIGLVAIEHQVPSLRAHPARQMIKVCRSTQPSTTLCVIITDIDASLA